MATEYIAPATGSNLSLNASERSQKRQPRMTMEYRSRTDTAVGIRCCHWDAEAEEVECVAKMETEKQVGTMEAGEV